MANTTNLNLVKPAGTDYALVSVINGNMDIIDSKVGAIPANESAQSQITALNNQTVPNRKTITLNNSRDVAFGVLTANSNLRLWIPHQINLEDGSNGSVTSASITYLEAYVNGSDIVLTQSITGLNNGSYSAYGIVLNITGSYGSLGISLNTPMICPVKGTIVLG